MSRASNSPPAATRPIPLNPAASFDSTLAELSSNVFFTSRKFCNQTAPLG